MNSLGDLAESAAEKLKEDHLSAIRKDEISIDDRGPLYQENKKSIFSKIHFSWRTEDRLILEQVKASAQQVFEEQFSGAIALLDQFYSSVRNEDGKENWDKVTGDEIEAMLFKLSGIRFGIMPQINDLLMDAIYSKHCADDAYSDVWMQVIDGTQGDKSAKASRDSREDKYHSFFRFYLYTTADTFMKELDKFTRLLERVRDWGVRGGYRG